MRFSSPLPVEMTKFMSFSKRLDKVLENEPRTPRSPAGKAEIKAKAKAKPAGRKKKRR